MTIVQAPHTSSRQFDEYDTGVVRRPDEVTGLRWICMSAEMTFIIGSHGSVKSSQRGGAPADSCRLILKRTLLSSAIVGVAFRYGFAAAGFVAAAAGAAGFLASSGVPV